MDWAELSAVLYPWIKAAHIIFVIFWMAGLFMLPRYYIYHQEAVPGSEEEQRWIDRERTIDEIILSIRRAGADVVLTYWAAEVARRLRP